MVVTLADGLQVEVLYSSSLPRIKTMKTNTGRVHDGGVGGRDGEKLSRNTYATNVTFFFLSSSKAIFHSRVIGTCPVTTDCIVAKT